MKQGFTLWFTGLSGSGKTTLSKMVTETLLQHTPDVELLDGDIIRTNLSKGLGFSKEDRDENVKRIGFVCQLLSRHKTIAVVAAISPYEEVRQFNRKRIENYVEVFCKCDLDTLISRDVKGLYKRALNGEISNFTGIDDPYEAPQTPDIIAHTGEEVPEESHDRIIGWLKEKGFLE